MDGLNYDDIEKMLESQQWRKQQGQKRPGGRYLDVVRPGAEMKRTPARVVSNGPAAVAVQQTTVAAVSPEAAEKIEAKVEKLQNDIEDITGSIENLIIEEEPGTLASDAFLSDAPNPFLPDAIERVVKRPLSSDMPVTAPSIPGRSVNVEMTAVKSEPEEKPKRHKTIYAKDKVSDALTKEVDDKSLEREVEAVLLEQPKRARKNKGNTGLLVFCIALILVFGAVAGFLVYYLFFR
jgi:hypothetical protein